jgi:hypothetical protein
VETRAIHTAKRRKRKATSDRRRPNPAPDPDHRPSREGSTWHDPPDPGPLRHHPNPEGVYMARWFGLGLLAIGLSTWLARDAAESAGGQAIAAP